MIVCKVDSNNMVYEVKISSSDTVEQGYIEIDADTYNMIMSNNTVKYVNGLFVSV